MRENNEKPDWFPLPVHLEKPATLEHWARCIATRLDAVSESKPEQGKATDYRKFVFADKEVRWQSDVDDKLIGVKCLCSGHVEANTDPRREFRLPVLINIALDDATLKEHFAIWLAAHRNGPARFHRIDDAFLDRCHAMRVLAAFDLFTWRTLTGATYSDAMIASWLWPDSGPLSDGTFVDRAERLRKVAKPLIDQVMQWQTVDRLEQCIAKARFIENYEAEEKSLNLVPEREKAA